VHDTFIFHSDGSVETEGNLDFHDKPPVRLPDSLVRVGGNLYLNGLTSAEGLTLPREIRGYLSLNGLTSAEGLVLPREIHGRLFLNGLTSAQGLVLPEKVGWEVWLNRLPQTEMEKIKSQRSDLRFML
ncbi:hypothetical protein HY631_02475, partial [Candidatus Uhrbacteria bacterium]|nr:hypothetical protein [Candidatus Uhrbacteria bacterium]